MRHISIVPLAILLTMASAGPATGQSPSASTSSPAPSPSGSLAVGPAPGSADAACGPIVTTAEIGASVGTAVTETAGEANLAPPESRSVTCRWILEDGSMLTLQVLNGYTLTIPDASSGATPVEGLGLRAYARQGGEGPFLAWAVPGETAERAFFMWSPGLTAEQLLALAGAMRSDAELAEDIATPDPSRLVGTWRVVEAGALDLSDGKTTFRFTEDGRLTWAHACSKKPLMGLRYEAAADGRFGVEIVKGLGKYPKRCGYLPEQLVLGFGLLLSGGRWELVFDTLRLRSAATGEPVYSLERVRP